MHYSFKANIWTRPRNKVSGPLGRGFCWLAPSHVVAPAREVVQPHSDQSPGHRQAMQPPAVVVEVEAAAVAKVGEHEPAHHEADSSDDDRSGGATFEVAVLGRSPS